MKKQFLVISIIFALAAINLVSASEITVNITRAANNYLFALGNENNGVVESAIMNVMKMRLEYPEYNYTEIIKALNNVSEKSSNAVTKRKAHIASVYLKYPDRFNWIKKNTTEKNNAFFELLATRIERQEQNLKTKYAASDSIR